MERLVALYRDHLNRERGLSPKSIDLYEPLALRFLTERFPSGRPEPARLTAADGVSITGAGAFPTRFFGTSAAAPHAAAIAALLKSANAALTR